jgi:hypothetical protein
VVRYWTSSRLGAVTTVGYALPSDRCATRDHSLVRISPEKADAINNCVIACAHNAVFANSASTTIAAAFDLTEFGKNTDLPPSKLD